MQRREKLIFGEADVALGPADGRGRVLALETRHFGGHLGNQNQCEGVIGASIGNGASVTSTTATSSVRGDHRSAQRARGIRRRTSWGPGSAGARDHAPSTA